MPIGPGKYGARAERLLREVEAALVVVITLGGRGGPAFDVATINPALLQQLPTLLRDTAASIEEDLAKEGPP